MRSAKSVIHLTILALVLLWPGTGMSKNIKVGAAINLTGPASTWGSSMPRGSRIISAMSTKSKGVWPDNKIEMILADTAYKVPEAVAAVRKFAVQDQVDMIATWGAGEGLAAKPIIQKYQIPTINYSTSWEILEPPIEYMYLPFGSYRLDCEAVLDYILAIHKGKEPPKGGSADLQQRLWPIHPQTEPGIRRRNRTSTLWPSRNFLRRPSI